MDRDTDLRRELTAILEHGDAVRRRVGAMVATAAEGVLRTGGSLLQLAREVTTAAAAASAEVYEARPGATLHEVIDGLGDGLRITAQAAWLTLEEARGGAVSFCRDDLQRLGADLDALSLHFVDAVVTAATGALPHTRRQVADLRHHAHITLARTAPALASAAAAARADPLGLGRQALAAGGATARAVAGALFTAVGTRLVHQGACWLRPTHHGR